MLLASNAYAADVPMPDADTAGWIKGLYEAATAGEWKVFAGLALIGCVYPLRLWGPKIVKGAFGGLVVAFLVSIAGTLGLAMAAGAKVTAATVITALGTAATAAGLWEWIKAHVPGGKAVSAKAKA